MKVLSNVSTKQVSAAAISDMRIHPTDWLGCAGVGMAIASAVFTVTAFSANPVGFKTALSTGAAIGAGFGALYDLAYNVEHYY